jgi:hypothetical protein
MRSRGVRTNPITMIHVRYCSLAHPALQQRRCRGQRLSMKTIKRQMYGRVNFDLLRLRAVLAE